MNKTIKIILLVITIFMSVSEAKTTRVRSGRRIIRTRAAAGGVRG